MLTPAPNGQPPACAPTSMPSPSPSVTTTTRPPQTEPSAQPSACTEVFDQCSQICFLPREDSTRPQDCADLSDPLEEARCNILPQPSGCNCCAKECSPENPMLTPAPNGQPPACAPTSMPSPSPSIPDVCDEDDEIFSYYQHGNNQAPPRVPIQSVEFGTSGSDKTVSFKVFNPFQDTHDIFAHYETVGFGSMQCGNNRDSDMNYQSDVSVTAKCNANSQALVHIYAVGKDARDIKSNANNTTSVPQCCMAGFDDQLLPKDTVIWTYTINCECKLKQKDCFCEE